MASQPEVSVREDNHIKDDLGEVNQPTKSLSSSAGGYQVAEGQVVAFS